MNIIQWLLWMLVMLGLIQPVGQLHTLSVAGAPQMTPQPTRAPTYAPVGLGRATYYSSGLLERVAAHRGLTMNGAGGFSTYPDCSMIGRYLWVSVQNPHTLGWSRWDVKRIVDCSQPRDYARHLAEGLVELSYRDAVRYGYQDEGHARVKFYLEEGK